MVATVPIAVVLHALLAFPSGRVTTRSGRILTAAGYVVTTVLVTSQYLVTPQPPPYDPLFVADRPDIRAVWSPVVVAAAVALAVDHERLTVELLAGREQLRESRLRLVESGDRERRRLAQDLHDRLQSRLVLLAITASGPDGREAVRRGLDEAIDELRRIVQGVMPALLLERGLAAAVRDLAARSPLPVDLEIDLGNGSGIEVVERAPEPVESTAYLVVAEALTNTVKHAEARSARVRLWRENGRLRIEVRDDGRGGADPAGHGLDGLHKRLAALDGTLAIASPVGGPTVLYAEVPCAS